MIDIFAQKSLFPLKNFEDIENIFKFNIDEKNGEPNLALLSIVSGLLEHSLVTVVDKDDLALNSRPVNHCKNVAKNRFMSNNKQSPNSPPSSHYHNNNNHPLLSSTSNNDENQQKLLTNPEHNEAGGYLSSDDSSRQSANSSPDISANDNLIVPEIEFEVVETLYKRFVDQFKLSIDSKEFNLQKTNLKIKKISDTVWEHLPNNYYKDKAHLQSIFSYLTTSKLDCFGLAFAVIAGCQILNLKNVYLALSEDHAWVMFDHLEDMKAQKDREVKEYIENKLPIPTCALHGTCEVTWHGKANSDKRGQPVTYRNCWLYTNGYAVKCDIRGCVVALVNSMNPSINSNTDSEVMALLQQRLLWLLFRRNMYFPMSLGNLGELEDICPTPRAPLSAHELFNLGIEISRNDFNDSHVYPYSYLASFFFKHGRFKEALETWADASAVMTKYNYSRDDEEIYKEFFEVANELMRSMLKDLTAGGLEPGKGSDKPFLDDPECLALILKFYDNICCWEEGSSTPVLHVGWAKNFYSTISRFSYGVRSKIKLLTEDEWTQRKANASELEISSRADPCSSTAIDHAEKKLKTVHESRSTTDAAPSESAKTILDRSRKGASSDDKVDTSASFTSRRLKLEDSDSIEATPSGSDMKISLGQRVEPAGQREKRIHVDKESNSVTVILKSRKIAGVRDLLQMENFNRTPIELQLTAQSQCAVRGKPTSRGHSSDFISSAPTTLGGSLRPKRLHR